MLEHSVSALYEISIEVLLLHGLLPNNAVSVIGVCWFLGVVFLFLSSVSRVFCIDENEKTRLDEFIYLIMDCFCV